jgi:hypothetical protein
VNESGGVSEIERFPLERGTKNITGDEPDRCGEVGISQKLPALFDELGVRFEGEEGTRSTDALAEAFEPERGGASGVEDLEAFDIAKEVQLAVAEGDEISLVRLAFFRRKRVFPIKSVRHQIPILQTVSSGSRCSRPLATVRPSG